MVRNILVIKFFGMGSILLTTPALAIIHLTFPKAEVTYLSFSQHGDLLKRLSNIDRILTIGTSSLFKFIVDAISVLFHILRTDYDIIFDFEFFSKFSTFVSGLTRAPARVGFALPTRWRSLLLTHQVPLPKNRHVSTSFCEQVFTLSSPRPISPLQPPRIENADVLSFASKISLNEKPIICINVNAGEKFIERRWNPERFASVLDSVSANRDYNFYFIGLKSEREYVQSVIDLTRCSARCYNAAGELTMVELIVLLRRCKLLITNDSGPVHLASAIGTPIVALFGPETPEFYGPRGNNAIVVYKAISCSPCMNIYAAKTFKCPYDAKCMKEISTKEVQEAVEIILNSFG